MEVTMKKLLLLTLLFSAPALQIMSQVPSLFEVTARAMANYDLDQFSRLDLKNKSLPEELEDKLKKELQPMLWQFADIKKRLQGHTAAVFSVAISPDTRFIVTGSWDNTARIEDAQTGTLLNTLQGHTSGVKSVAISPDSRFIVTGSEDTTARIWDVQTGALLNTLRGHTNRVFSVAISPDSRFIVTGSWDNTARIWDAQTGALLNTLQGHTSVVSSVAISPDNNFIVTGSWDATARIFSIEQVIKELSLEQLMFIKTLKNHAQKNPQGFALSKQQAEWFCDLPSKVQEQLSRSCKITLPWFSHTSLYVNAGISWLKNHKLLATGAVAGLIGLYCQKDIYQ